jgi:hypothetical protein
MLAQAVLLMEALEGFSHKFQYGIVAHSGSTAGLELVRLGCPPTTSLEKYTVVQQVYGAWPS